MKKIIVIILAFILNSCEEKYSSLTEKNTNVENLLTNIKPNKNIKYWQLEYFSVKKIKNIPDKIILKKGKYINELPITEFKRGFFGALISYRIIYFEDSQWKVVDNENLLKQFIGEIDNKYEAFLIAKINNYSIDSELQEGNGYIKTDFGYKIKVMKYKSCPVSKESFTMLITKDGQIENTKSNGIYFKSSDCISH
jgi:hypothetical protein